MAHQLAKIPRGIPLYTSLWKAHLQDGPDLLSAFTSNYQQRQWASMGCPFVGSCRRQSFLLSLALIRALLCVVFQVPRGEFNYTSFVMEFSFDSYFINLPRLVKKDNTTKSSVSRFDDLCGSFQELCILIANRKFLFGSTWDIGTILGKYSLTFSHLRILSASLSK